MAHWSPAIANAFIRRALEDGKPLNQMQIQKLVYIAHGWHLMYHDKPLTKDDPEAWDYGPVYRFIYDALIEYGIEPVDAPIRMGSGGGPTLFAHTPPKEIIAVLSDTERKVIDDAYRYLAHFPAFKLSAVTHDAASPWAMVYAGGAGLLKDIPPDLIRDYFVRLERPDAA